MTTNYLLVFLGAVISTIIGALWYGPLFGKQWMKMIGMTPEKMEAGKKSIGKSYCITFIGSLFMSYVLLHALVYAESYLQMTGVGAGLMVGFWNWLGFIVPVTLGSVLWEGKSWKLWFINNGYYLITLLIIGAMFALY